MASHQANRGHPVSAYGATKYAVRGLAQQVAAEYASYGIRANSISPGYALNILNRTPNQASSVFDIFFGN